MQLTHPSLLLNTFFTLTLADTYGDNRDISILGWKVAQGSFPQGLPPGEDVPRNGPKQNVTCTTNSLEYRDKVLTNQICQKVCKCDITTGWIACEEWNGCSVENVEWNCACHSAPVPPEGKCRGFVDYAGSLWAEKKKRWPVIKPNAQDTHVGYRLVANYKRWVGGLLGEEEKGVEEEEEVVEQVEGGVVEEGEGEE